MTRRSCYRRRLGPVVFLLYYCSFVLFVPSVLVPACKRHHSVIPHVVLQSLGFPFAVGFVSSLPTHMSHTSSYSTVYGFLLSIIALPFASIDFLPSHSDTLSIVFLVFLYTHFPPDFPICHLPSESIRVTSRQKSEQGFHDFYGASNVFYRIWPSRNLSREFWRHVFSIIQNFT